MLRWIILAVAILTTVAMLLATSWLPAPLEALLAAIFQFVVYVVAPIFLALLLVAPGMFPSLVRDAQSAWRRLMGGPEKKQLRAKIDQLDKPHHMLQLANLHFAAGQYADAAAWYQAALDRDAMLVEARYKLGLCAFARRDFANSAQLLEGVNQEKPGYDYGMTYLRLAESHARLGNRDRAAELFQTMLRFYPGHAEACYEHGKFLAAGGEWTRASEEMRTLLAAAKTAPPFQRRRNRHWAIKARWWLFRFGKRRHGQAEETPLVAAVKNTPRGEPPINGKHREDAAAENHVTAVAGERERVN